MDKEFNHQVDKLASAATTKNLGDKVENLKGQIEKETDVENKPKLEARLEKAIESKKKNDVKVQEAIDEEKEQLEKEEEKQFETNKQKLLSKKAEDLKVK